MSLLDDLRGVGEQLVEDALPLGREVAPLLGALIAHLEAKGGELATVELDKLAGKLKPPEPPAAGTTASGPIATEPTEGPSKAELEARLSQLEQAGAAPPAVTVDQPPPPA